jgi:hypothetical protein
MLKDKMRVVRDTKAKDTIFMRFSIPMMMERVTRDGDSDANQKEEGKFPVHP